VNTCDRLKSEALALRLGLLFAAIIAIQNLLAAVWVNADTPLPVGQPDPDWVVGENCNIGHQHPDGNSYEYPYRSNSCLHGTPSGHLDQGAQKQGGAAIA